MEEGTPISNNNVGLMNFNMKISKSKFKKSQQNEDHKSSQLVEKAGIKVEYPCVE